MKKRQKSKMTMLIVGGLAVVSLVSVGFANWAITAATSATANNINVSVGSVDDNTLTTTIITQGNDASDLTLKFDNVAGGGSNKIFSNTGETEDLVFTIKFQIEGAVLASKLNTVEFTFDEGIAGTSSTNEGANPLTNLKNPSTEVDYLCYPWISTRKVDFTYSAGNKSFTYNSGKNDNEHAVAPTISVSAQETNNTKVVATARFEFNWGQAFNYANPGNSDVPKDTLIARLNAFNTAFTNATSGGKTLSVKVTPTLKA